MKKKNAAYRTPGRDSNPAASELEGLTLARVRGGGKHTTKHRFTTETTTGIAELQRAHLARVHGGNNGWAKAAVPRPTTDGNDPWP